MSGADALVAALTRRYLAEVKERTLIGEVISTSVGGYEAIEAIMEGGGSDRWRTIRASTIDHLVISNVPLDVAKWYAYGPIFVHAPGAIRLAQRYDRDPLECLQVMLAVGEAVSLDRLDEVQQDFTPGMPWERWAIQSIMDDLIGLRRRLGAAVLRKREGLTGEEAVAAYVKRHTQ